MASQETISSIGCVIQTPNLQSDPPPVIKKKRNLPGNPDPEAEVIALSPKTLMATNRFPCEICGKGFQRDQNLQLHRRGHNLPWKLKQRSSKEVVRKRVYVCPEKSCVHSHPSRALGDLTGIKKHFCRKHGEKKWKCEKCSKRYAVQSDCKAHSKTCGTREYRCDCGTLFSRRDSFITHRAFCEALAEETARLNAGNHLNNNFPYLMMGSTLLPPPQQQHFSPGCFKPTITDQTRPGSLSLWMTNQDVHQTGLFNPYGAVSDYNWDFGTNNKDPESVNAPSLFSTQQQQQSLFPVNMSATALLQKAAEIGATSSSSASVEYPSMFLQSFGFKLNNRDLGGQKLFGLTGSNPVGASTDESNGVSVSTLDELPEMNPAKRRRMEDVGITGGGETRDFLGVGIQEMCHPPPSINIGWI